MTSLGRGFLPGGRFPGGLAPWALTGAFARVRKLSYVLATDWGAQLASPFPPIAEPLRHDPGWKVTDLKCGHDVMVDMPKETAEILIAAGA